jgi:predicted O-methyltransferase YrrM
MEGVSMSITTDLLALDAELQLHNEGEWSNTKSNWSAFNSGGVECEVGEFFYGMLRMMKPQNVLETGTHHGVGASYMGMALKENGFGHLDTVEFLTPNYDIAKSRMTRLGLDPFVTCYFGDVANFIPPTKYQFILLDTEPQTRFAELIKFYPYLDEGGYMFIHDLGRELQQKEIPGLEFAWPFGKIPEGIEELLADGSLSPFWFDTPRGLSGFYKRHSKDWKGYL